MATEYPKTFFADAKKRLPLKKGINKDITADLINKKDSPLLDFDIDDTLDWYTGHGGYDLCCSSAGAGRVDLDGKVVAKVTTNEAANHKKAAAEKLAQIEDAKAMPAFVTRPVQYGNPTIPVDTTLPPLKLLFEMKSQIDTIINVLGETPSNLMSVMTRPRRPAL